MSERFGFVVEPFNFRKRRVATLVKSFAPVACVIVQRNRGFAFFLVKFQPPRKKLIKLFDFVRNLGEPRQLSFFLVVLVRDFIRLAVAARNIVNRPPLKLRLRSLRDRQFERFRFVFFKRFNFHRLQPFILSIRPIFPAFLLTIAKVNNFISYDAPLVKRSTNLVLWIEPRLGKPLEVEMFFRFLRIVESFPQPEFVGHIFAQSLVIVAFNACSYNVASVVHRAKIAVALIVVEVNESLSFVVSGFVKPPIEKSFKRSSFSRQTI